MSGDFEMPNSPNPCTHTETSSVSGSNCAICFKLKGFDENVVEARQALERALEHRSAYLEEVNHACDPIQSLPNEVISSLFMLCIPCLPSLDIFDTTTSKTFQNYMAVQFLLGSICRYWRRIVWSTPDLWNTLWLKISDRTTVAHSQMVADWLRRSGQLPLSIFMFCLHNEDYESDDSDSDSDSDANADWDIDEPAWSPVAMGIIDTLSHYIDRMKVLHLSLPGPLLELFRINGNSIPRTNDRILEKLFIELRGPCSPDSNYQFGLAGEDPSPTHVSFRKINYQEIGIRWDNVTSLKVQDLFDYDALAILQLAPKLQVFKLSIVPDYNRGGPDKLPRVTHRSLRVLCLTRDTKENFLDSITCPVMDELSYHLTIRTSQSLVDFLGRSACNLKDLSLNVSMKDPAESLLPVLTLTPSLTHLSLGKCGIPNTLLPSFRKTELLPHLSSFSSTAFIKNFRWSNIPSLVTQSQLTRATSPRMRSKSLRPLSRIAITFVDSHPDPQQYIDYANLTRILGLVRNGIEVEIKTHEGRDIVSLSKARHGLD